MPSLTASSAHCTTCSHGDTTPQLLPRHLEYFRNAQMIWVAGGTFHSAGCAMPEATLSFHTLFTWGGGAPILQATHPLGPRSQTLVEIVHYPDQEPCAPPLQLSMPHSSRRAPVRLCTCPPVFHPPTNPCTHPSLLHFSNRPLHVSGTYGKLGQQDTMNSLTPRPVKNVANAAYFVQVECGTFHTIALSKLGDMYTFGYNGNGRLGLAEMGKEDTKPRSTPVAVKVPDQVMRDMQDLGGYAGAADSAESAFKKVCRAHYIPIVDSAPRFSTKSALSACFCHSRWRRWRGHFLPPAHR